MSVDRKPLNKNSQLEWAYFEWLYSRIGVVSDRNPKHSHWLLAEHLHNKEFTWFIPNDDSRALDGIFLREEFIAHIDGNIIDLAAISGPCSMFEMLIALASRISFSMDSGEDDGTGGWFWELLRNIKIDHLSDEYYGPFEHDEVERILDVVIDRTYDSNGVGSLFPLRNSRFDMRFVEIWYQMSAYLLEKNLDL